MLVLVVAATAGLAGGRADSRDTAADEAWRIRERVVAPAEERAPAFDEGAWAREQDEWRREEERWRLREEEWRRRQREHEQWSALQHPDAQTNRLRMELDRAEEMRRWNEAELEWNRAKADWEWRRQQWLLREDDQRRRRDEHRRRAEELRLLHEEHRWREEEQRSRLDEVERHRRGRGGPAARGTRNRRKTGAAG